MAAGLVVGAALAAAPAAPAAYPGSPGKVAFLDDVDPYFPLQVFHPDPSHPDGGTVQDVRARTWTFPGEGRIPTPGWPTPPSWSPDGTRLAYAAQIADTGFGGGATHQAIFVWNLRTGAVRQVTQPPPGVRDEDSQRPDLAFVASDMAPVWSPDGQTIAFVRFMQAGQDHPQHGQRGADVWTVPAGASSASGTRLADLPAEDLTMGLAWGGDPADPLGGSLVGLLATRGPDLIRLARIDHHSGVTTDLVTSASTLLSPNADYDVAPDGRSAAYAVPGLPSGHQIWTTSTQGGAQRLLANVQDGRLRFSPTGNGPLRIALAPVQGTPGESRYGLLERQIPDPGADQWAGEPQDRFVSRYAGPTGSFGYASAGRSLWDVQPQRLPIIVIPGFAGSTLKCEGVPRWAPGFSPAENGASLMALRLADDGVSPAGCLGAGPTEDPDAPDALVSTALGAPIYRPMEDLIDQMAPGERSFRFSWDWRKAPSRSIDRLDAFITKVLATEPALDQGLRQVVVYGHSYGGLLTREYITRRPERIARVLTSGSPYWGAAKPIYPITFGIENPMAGVIDLDTFLPDAALKAISRNGAGLHHLLPSDNFGPWLSVGGQPQDQAGVRAFIAGPAGGNGAMADLGRTWHQAHDGFETVSGAIDWRAVISTGLLTISGADMAPAAEADGTLTSIVRLGDGDGTVPVRSASQGPVGTRTPLGDPVHVQAICGQAHIPLAGDPRVGDAYREFLLTGAAPRRTEGRCDARGVSVKVVRLDSTPGAGALAATAVAPQAAVGLDEAAQAGRIQLLELPDGPLAIMDDRTALPLRLAGPGERVRVEVTRHEGEQAGPAAVYEGLSGEVVLTPAPGGAAVTVDGVPVAPAAPAPAPPGAPDPAPAPGATPPAAAPAPTPVVAPRAGAPARARVVCRVPRLRGLTLPAARRALVRARCAVGPVRPKAVRGRTVVRAQRPAAGAVLPRGTRVAVVLVRINPR
ncbi:MAG: hypothetical protein MUE51_04040 [Thermoleophilia bacterium]|nr:hypothetical protein [Thermoleophilia bacterium]